MARRSLLAGALSLSLLVGTAGVAAAHDDGCIAQLRDLPLETVQVPGQTWEEIAWLPVSMNVELYGWLGFKKDPYFFAALTCSVDAAADMARRTELRKSFGSAVELEMETTIGDESTALLTRTKRRDPGEMDITWRHGNVLGTASADAAFDFSMLQHFAEDIDALLP
jgi:hypothetical protein